MPPASSGSQPSLYLTFDDGPHPEITPWVIQKLKQAKAKATFFCVGQNVERYPYVIQELRQAGHGIGNHTQTHANGWKTEPEVYLREVAQCQEVLKSVGVETNLFRPPYGRLSMPAANALAADYEIIMWSVLTQDYDQSLHWEEVLANATTNLKDGDILVFHDSEKAWPHLQKVLPAALAHYVAQGFALKAINF
jgi:peptidoglycan/xylan/chitin deacetylase (PgdA/CDA1 family)